MKIGQDVITASEWANESSITPGSRKNRKGMLEHLAKANGYDTIAQLLDQIRTDKLTVYSTCKRLVDSMLKTHAITSVYNHRSMLPGFFQSVLGEEDFRLSVFKRLVPIGKTYPTTTKAVPTPDGLREMLTMTSPQYKALLGVIAGTGCRIMEALTRKWSDLDIRESGYGRFRFQASETKARTQRFAFINRETVMWIRTYQTWLGVKSDYIFPGENPVKHLQYGSALQQLKRLFDRCGMKDKDTEIFSPHSFRTFADAQMRKCSLDSKYVSAIIGHVNKLQSEQSYLDWSEIEKEWLEKCEQKMTWLSESVLQNRLADEQKKTDNLQSLLTMALSPDQMERLKDFLSREVKR